MPGRKRYDALKSAVDDVQLPIFVSRDGTFYLDPSFDGQAWETLKTASDNIADKAKDLDDHPHLHGSHQEHAGDLLTAATTFQQMALTAYNEWRAVPDGGEVKQTEAMVGLGNVLQFMKGKLRDFDQDKLDALTAAFGS